MDFVDSTLQIRGLELRVLDSGTGADPGRATFVLVHGLGVSSVYFRDLAHALAAHGRVLALDLPGFGRTDRPERSLRVAEYAMVLTEALGRMGIEDAVLVGHSMGCQVVVEALARDQSVGIAGVLLGPVVNPAQRRLPRLVLRFAQSILRETPRSVTPSLLAWLRTGPRMLIDTFPTMVGYPIHERISAVGAPLLLLAGAKDRMAPRSWLERLAQAAGGEAHILVVEDASHQVMVTDTGIVTDAALRFAERQHP